MVFFKTLVIHIRQNGRFLSEMIFNSSCVVKGVVVAKLSVYYPTFPRALEKASAQYFSVHVLVFKFPGVVVKIISKCFPLLFLTLFCI